MATTRTAKTHWEGALLEGGSGQVSLESSGLGTFDVSWPRRASSVASARYGWRSPSDPQVENTTRAIRAMVNGKWKMGNGKW